MEVKEIVKTLKGIRPIELSNNDFVDVVDIGEEFIKLKKLSKLISDIIYFDLINQESTKDEITRDIFKNLCRGNTKYLIDYLEDLPLIEDQDFTLEYINENNTYSKLVCSIVIGTFKNRDKFDKPEIVKDLKKCIHIICRDLDVKVFDIEVEAERVFLKLQLRTTQSVDYVVGQIKSKTNKAMKKTHPEIVVPLWNKNYFCTTKVRKNETIRSFVEKELEEELIYV